CTGQVDYTVGIGCDDAAGDTHFPVCNRGTAPANAGSLRLGITNGPPGGEHSCNTQSVTSRGVCTIDLTTLPIAAGACIDVDVSNPATGITCSGVSINGNRSVYINEGGSPLAECDPCNNWSANNHQSCSGYGGLPPPSTQTFTYTATCPAQTRPQWKELA